MRPVGFGVRGGSENLLLGLQVCDGAPAGMWHPGGCRGVLGRGDPHAAWELGPSLERG